MKEPAEIGVAFDAIDPILFNSVVSSLPISEEEHGRFMMLLAFLYNRANWDAADPYANFTVEDKCATKLMVN